MAGSGQDLAVSVERTGDTLRLSGPLHRAAVAALWKRLPALDGVRELELSAVPSIDSAGLALLVHMAQRCGGQARVVGRPSGLDALESAYRLSPGLGFAD